MCHRLSGLFQIICNFPAGRISIFKSITDSLGILCSTGKATKSTTLTRQGPHNKDWQAYLISQLEGPNRIELKTGFTG